MLLVVNLPQRLGSGRWCCVGEENSMHPHALIDCEVLLQAGIASGAMRGPYAVCRIEVLKQEGFYRRA